VTVELPLEGLIALREPAICAWINRSSSARPRSARSRYSTHP
jgi:hypothetical protein